MIVQEFNQGWGDEIKLRQFEKKLLSTYLKSWIQDDSRSVMINSTWYTQDYHLQVVAYLKQNPVDRVALVSFMDPAIVQADWFDNVVPEVASIGYYQGAHEIDVWALIVDRYFHNQTCRREYQSIDTPFLCYNRKPHWHRLRLIRELDQMCCLTQGIVTLGDQSGSPVLNVAQDVEPSLIAPNPGTEQYGIVNDIMSLGNLEVWNRCFLNVVTETVFDVDSQWFVSEKIYKSVMGSGPFLVYAPNGARGWLSHVGLLDFCDDFSDITDLDLSEPENMALFLRDLAKQPRSYLHKKYIELVPKISYNRCTFSAHVARTQEKIQRGI